MVAQKILFLVDALLLLLRFTESVSLKSSLNRSARQAFQVHVDADGKVVAPVVSPESRPSQIWREQSRTRHTAETALQEPPEDKSKDQTVQVRVDAVADFQASLIRRDKLNTQLSGQVKQELVDGPTDRQVDGPVERPVDEESQVNHSHKATETLEEEKMDDSVRQGAILDECMMHVRQVWQSSSTVLEFRTAVLKLCVSEFSKAINEVVLAVECKTCKQAASKFISTDSCMVAAGKVENSTSLAGMDKSFCNALAMQALPDIKKVEAQEKAEDPSQEKAAAGGCGHRSGSFCFPADAQVIVRAQGGNKVVALTDLRIGDYVQTADAVTGSTWFTEVLTDWHSELDHETDGVEFLMLVHSYGSINLTADHFIATKDNNFVPAAHVRLGDSILWQTDRGLVNSKVNAVRRVTKRGMYSPLTWTGRLLVNNILASSYTAAPGMPPAALGNAVQYLGWDGVHSLIHSVVLPIRLVHALRVPSLLDCLTWAPGINWLKRTIVPCNENAVLNLGRTTLPRYVEAAVSVNTAVFTALPMSSAGMFKPFASLLYRRT